MNTLLRHRRSQRGNTRISPRQRRMANRPRKTRAPGAASHEMGRGSEIIQRRGLHAKSAAYGPGGYDRLATTQPVDQTTELRTQRYRTAIRLAAAGHASRPASGRARCEGTRPDGAVARLLSSARAEASGCTRDARLHPTAASQAVRLGPAMSWVDQTTRHVRLPHAEPCWRAGAATSATAAETRIAATRQHRRSSRRRARQRPGPTLRAGCAASDHVRGNAPICL